MTTGRCGSADSPSGRQRKASRRSLAYCDQYSASRFVVGHTISSTKRVTARFGARVFLIDTGMLSSHYRGGRATALEIEDDRITAVYLGERIPLVAPTSVPSR